VEYRGVFPSPGCAARDQAAQTGSICLGERLRKEPTHRVVRKWCAIRERVALGSDVHDDFGDASTSSGTGLDGVVEDAYLRVGSLLSE